MRETIAERIDKRDIPLPVKTEYWTGLSDLFRLIDIGSEAYGISKDVLYVPPYNGGLFDPARNQFLQEKVVGDYYVAQAIDLLGRAENGSGKGFVDYSSLEIRHLGSIYEGLLEYRLMVAEGDMVAVRDKGKDKWVPKEEWDGKVREEVETGGLYLATDKGERKATGSYYTPDYIVKYIIKNVLDPLIEKKKEEWIDRMDQPFWQVLLEIRILDPAMGSGHFLVEATDYLARELVRAWAEARPEETESEEVAEQDVQWAKREVVRRCIYGVDLNPMAVELAKLSMWLSTVAANKPLTFLDHHLKVGNSLIGANVGDLEILPTFEKKRKIRNANAKRNTIQDTLWNSTIEQHFDDLIKRYGEIAEQTDDDLATVKKKQKEYDALKESELNLRFHELANVWLSVYFENNVPPGEYATMQNETHPDHFPSWDAWRGKEWFRRAQEIAQEKRFYHWELEFPEVFYEKGVPKENPGWDAVVGNPPYIRMTTMEKPDFDYLESNYISATGHYDIY
ncbi:MAG: N-6 DNA methylase, partial [Proteobacteria bacterium]|nr:N-6 DNA methylase [Pseudomonadota bacterium]